MYVSSEDPGLDENFLQVGKKTANSPMGKWVKRPKQLRHKEETVQASHHTRMFSLTRNKETAKPTEGMARTLTGACGGARGGSTGH